MTDAIAPATDAPAPAAATAPGGASAGTVHSVREIEGLIPHRWPFLLVDRIVEYDPDAKRIVGIKAVTATEWFFQGHFPGLPVMPGVFQVEALAQTMAVYVAKQPGFGDRIGLFAGIDEVRFKRIVVPGDTLRLEITMEKLGSRFGKGRGVASVDGEVACEGAPVASSSRRPGRCDDADRGPVRHPRQPAGARGHDGRDPRRAPGRRPRRRRPRAQRPGPGRRRRRAACAGVRRRRRRVAATRTSPSPTSTTAPRSRSTRTASPRRVRIAAEWAHDELSDEQLAWLRRLPSERRIRADDDSLVLVVHASPGSQTRGFDQALDANVMFERAVATDARVICVGHTHIPEVRDLGWKVIVNGGSAGYVFDGDPTASWASLTIVDGEVHADIRRTAVRRADGRQRDLRPRPARATCTGPRRCARGSWSDDLVLAGPAAPRRRHRHGRRHAARQRRRARPGPASLAGRSGVATIASFDPSRLAVRIAAEIKDFDPSDILDRKDMRRTDRYIQFALVCAHQALVDAGLPPRLDDDMAARSGVIIGSGLGGVSTLFDNVLVMAERGPGPHLAVLHPDGHRERRLGPGRDRLRRDRTQLRDGVGVRDRRPRARASRGRRSGAATRT